MAKDTATTLFHITTRAELESAVSQGSYEPTAYASDGFVHCSYLHQVIKVANRFYGGEEGLVLLEISAEKIGAAIVNENLEGGDELFPHVYGQIPVQAITAVHDFPANLIGKFVMPPSVHD